MRGIEELGRRLRERRPAAPAPALRDRVLAAADGVRPAPAPAWPDRLWFSRGMRVAWATAIVVLLGLLALSDRRVDRSIEESFGGAEAGERPQVASLARELEVRTIWEYRPTAGVPRRRAGRATAGEEMR